MLIHDFNASSSLFDPWTTLIAVVALVLLLGAILWKAYRVPLMSYCILFFFINHLIEGSFFSLELVYEHRNYLPSMLFFLPVVIGLLNILDFVTERKVVFVLFIGAVSSVMIIWGVSTFMYNSVFKNEITLWHESVEKTPGLQASHHNLGLAYINAGRLPEAYDELQKAQRSDRLANVTNKYRFNITLMKYYIAVGEIDKVLYYVNEALRFFPGMADLHNLKGVILLEKDRLEEAEKEVKTAIALKPGDDMFHFNLGIIFLKKGHTDKAISEAKKSLNENPDSWRAYFLISDVFKARRNHLAADHFSQIGLKLRLEWQRMAGKTDPLNQSGV